MVGIGLLAISLGAGLAFAAVKLFTPGGMSSGPVQLKVTGTPPSVVGKWSSGVREVWRVSGSHRTSVDTAGLDSYTGFALGTPDAWAVYDFVGDTSLLYTGLDPVDGSRMWSDHIFRDCSPTRIDGLVACLDLIEDTGRSTWEPAIELVDWSTGEARKAWKLSALGLPDDMSPAAELTVVEDDMVVTLPQFEHGAGDYLGDYKGVVVARVSGENGTKIWEYRGSGCDASWYAESPGQRVQHGVLFPNWSAAIDLARGKPIYPGSGCARPIADGVVTGMGKSAELPNSIPAPDGTSLTTSPKSNGLSLIGDVPPPAIKLVDVEATSAGLMAYDPATGADKWARPVRVSADRSYQELSVGSVLVSQGRLIVANGKTLIAVDPLSGAVQWRRYSRDFSGVQALDEDTILVGSNDGELSGNTLALDAATGVTLWQTRGYASPVLNQDGTQSLLSVIPGERGFVARIDPADRLTKPAVVPASAPPCPTGMAPISFTKYAGGAILLCRVGQEFRVIFPSHPDWQVSELTFTEGGHEVVFANGTRVRVVLGGAAVYTTSNGTVTSQPATQSWNDAQGEVKFSPPTEVKTCPAGSWPISLSTFDGGWLLVCGTAATQPTRMVLSRPGGQVEMGPVAYRNGGYCGAADVGEVCGYRSPAVVTVKASDGKVVQYSASSNYYDGYGQGGAGEGTGSYGVEAPEGNAKDQVRYLTQILQKSSAGRASLNAAVSQVRACSDLPGANSTLNDVVVNRQELLAALDSTPVDAVPRGSELVARLRDAIQLSYQSDQVWVQWAEAEQANGCADGESSSYYQQVHTMNQEVAIAKDSFLELWNSLIVPTYGAIRFTTAQI